MSVEVPKQTSSDEKAQKRFERIFAEVKEHWPWLAAGSATAASIISLGAALFYLRKMLKGQKLQEFDAVVNEEFSPEAVETASNLQNLGVVRLVIEIGGRLEGSPLGQEVQVKIAFMRGLLGIKLHSRGLADDLIDAATYVADAAKEQIEASWPERPRIPTLMKPTASRTTAEILRSENHHHPE